MNQNNTKESGQKLLTYDEQAIFCRQMAFIVKAGIPLNNAYDFLKTEAQDGDNSEVIEAVFAIVREGKNFSVALTQTGYFSKYLISVVELGEKTGNLERTLYELADYFEQRSVIRRKVTEAFTYPLILFVMMLAVILFLIIEVMPQFAHIISDAGGELPPFAAALLGFGEFVRGYWLSILVVVAGIIVVIVLLLRSRGGKTLLNRITLRKGAFGNATRKLSTARFCSAMKMALGCGNSFTSSVDLTADIISNDEVKKRLMILKQKIIDGEEIPHAIHEIDLFPSSFVSLFATAYKTGNLEETLERMSSYYSESFDDTISSVTAKIEPALVIVLSCIAGVLLFSVMIPIINIMQLIG